MDVLEGFEHGGEMPDARLAIELLGETLQVHVHRIHIRVELGSRLRQNVAGGDRHSLHADRHARSRHVDGELVKHDRVVVGERHTLAVEVDGAPSDCLRRGLVGQGVVLAGL